MSRSVSLRDISALLPGSYLMNDGAATTVTSLAFSSQNVESGALFFAIPGSSRDGHDFIADAKARGARAAVVSRQETLGDFPGIVVADPRDALSICADFWFHHPSKNLALVGVTGTNGKTTTNWIVYSLLNILGQKSFRMGTLGFYAPGVADEPDSLTSPDALTVQRDLARSFEGGCRAGVLEVSSHALDQSRMRQVRLKAAVFTNLTRDHLDYHKTMEHYGASKLKIIEMLSSEERPGRMVVNGDDPFSAEFIIASRKGGIEVVSFGFAPSADVRIVDLKNQSGRSSFLLKRDGREYPVHSPYIGNHNAQNVVGALLAVEALGFSLEEQLQVLGDIPQVSGRLEYVGKNGIDVYIDYAHTPDALQNVLSVLKPLSKGNLWTVCGCGGDRDRGKRPQMAKIAVEMADKAVFTSDNPRTEDPQQILADMVAEGAQPAILEADRALAIEQTLQQAATGDTVVIAGKGHENYQIIGTTKRPFSDAAIVRDFFSKT